MAQMQVILAELVRNFDFEPVDETEPWRLNAPIMSPSKADYQLWHMHKFD